MMTVKRQRPLQFKNDIGCVVDYGLLEKAILWKAGGFVHAPTAIFFTGRPKCQYPTVAIYGKAYVIHRLIMSYLCGYQLPLGIHVHHKDGNRLNNLVENLKIENGRDHVYNHLSKQLKIDVSLDKIRELRVQGWGIKRIARFLGHDRDTIARRIDILEPETVKRRQGKRWCRKPPTERAREEKGA